MLDLNFSSLFRYLMSLSPMIIASFLILASLLDHNVKGLVYLGGVLIVAILTIGFKRLFRVKKPDRYVADICQVFNIPPIMTDYSAPDFNSMFLSFTTTYLLLPMAMGGTSLNAILIIIMGMLVIGNGVTRVTQGCNNIIDIIIGIILGGGLGAGYFFAFWATNNRNLLFTDSIASNNVTCNRPSKQTFKCAVYKNGQLVKNL